MTIRRKVRKIKTRQTNTTRKIPVIDSLVIRCLPFAITPHKIKDKMPEMVKIKNTIDISEQLTYEEGCPRRDVGRALGGDLHVSLVKYLTTNRGL